MGGILATLWNVWQGLSQAYPPKSTFSVDQIPDLSGRVMLVTGGNSGIGYETCKALLAHNAKVYLAARNKDKAGCAIQKLKEETGKEAIFLLLDLASLASVKRAAQEFLSKETALHVLFNNAGVAVVREQLTADGYDLAWGTNVLGHFYFTELLVTALAAGARTSADQHSRVITTSSSAAYGCKIVWESIRDGPVRQKVGPSHLYLQSKLANVIVARQVALRYAHVGIVSISLNPGNIYSELYREVPELQQKIFEALFYRPPQGALTQLYAGTMPDALRLNGEFMIPWARPGKCRKEAYDDELGRRLWEWCEKEVKAFEARQ